MKATRLMRTAPVPASRRPVLSSLALAAVLLSWSAAPGQAKSFDLEKVMKGQEPGMQAEVRGTGGYYNDCIEVAITNRTGESATVEVPLGLLLVPSFDPGVQTMVCAGGERLEASQETSVHRIKAFCAEENDKAPGSDEVFSSGGRASGELLRQVKRIRDGQRFNISDQHEIWKVTESLDLSKGAGGASSAEKKATAAVILSTALLGAWQIMSRRAGASGAPSAPSDGGAIPPPGDEAGTSGDQEPQPESSDDRPAWSLVHRRDGDIFDAKNERWVSRDSAAGKAILEANRKKMEAEGFDYDAERDAFIERGLVYDEHTRCFRKPLASSEPAEIKPEEGDASKMYFGPGWLMTGDLGTSSDPEVVNKRLNDRLKYLEELEDDVQSEHEALADQLKKVKEQTEKDPWLEEQLRQRREDLKQKMRDVQEQKLGLTRRVDERAREYDTWADRQKKSWTAGKVGKELSEVFVPDPEQLRGLFERTLELRNKLQDAIKDQPALFSAVDGTVGRIKQIAAEMKAAQERGDTNALRSLQAQMAAARTSLDGLYKEMQMIHKKSAQWQAGSHVLTATAGMTAIQYVGQARTILEIGKSGASFLKPTIKPRGPTVFEPLRRADREFYAVDKSGNIRKITGADAPDFQPQKGELLVSRDPYSGRLTPQEYGSGGRGQPLTDGQKNLLRMQAERGLADRPLHPLETGRKYAGPPGVTTTADGSVTYQPPEEPARPPEPTKSIQIPRDLRELKDMVDKERLVEMVKAKPGSGQLKAEAQERIAEKLRRGERPSHSRKDVPFSEKEWVARDKALHPGQPNKMKKMGEILGIYPDARAKELASRNPDFARIDKAIREAFDESDVVADEVLNPEPGERFMELAAEKGVRPQDWKNWQKAMHEGEWHPIQENRPPTVQAGGPPAESAGVKQPISESAAPGPAPGEKPFGETMAGVAKPEIPPMEVEPSAASGDVAPSPGVGSAPAGQTVAAPPSTPSPDDMPMGSYETPKGQVSWEAAKPDATVQAPPPERAQAAQQPPSSAPAPSGAPSPAAPPRSSAPEGPAPAAPAASMPSSSPAIGESPGAAAAPKPASINRETVSAGDQCFGERATTLESAGGLERVGLEGAGMMEGAAGLESASNLEDLSSSLSSRDLSGAGPIESAGLEKEIPLQERSLSFARRLQGFLRKSE